jgi:hypothetical protein
MPYPPTIAYADYAAVVPAAAIVEECHRCSLLSLGLETRRQNPTMASFTDAHGNIANDGAGRRCPAPGADAAVVTWQIDHPERVVRGPPALSASQAATAIGSWKNAGQRTGEERATGTGTGSPPGGLAAKELPTSCPRRCTVSAAGEEVKAKSPVSGQSGSVRGISRQTVRTAWPARSGPETGEQVIRNYTERARQADELGKIRLRAACTPASAGTRSWKWTSWTVPDQGARQPGRFRCRPPRPTRKSKGTRRLSVRRSSQSRATPA